MANLATQDRGRPPEIFTPEQWLLIIEAAHNGLSQQEAADLIGTSIDVLRSAAGFSQVWASKRAMGHHRIARRLSEVALGEAEATMPQAATAMYLAKARMGWYDRPSETNQITLGPIQIALVGGQPGQSAQIVEGEPPQAAPALPSPPTDMPDISFA